MSPTSRPPSATIARSNGINNNKPMRPMSATSRPPSATIVPINGINDNKPMRPLTAYHLFFKLEREYIIQTLPGPDLAGDSAHTAKVCLHDVPRRYARTRLPPDWYLGPGKGRKRRHRRSHGKIGFLDLSNAISKRWATLATTDPETKRYVAGIAARELGDYKRQMKEYKQSAQSGGEVTGPCDATARPAAVISRSVSPKSKSTHHSAVGPPSALLPLSMACFQEPVRRVSTEIPEAVVSFEQSSVVSYEQSSSADEEEIDYTICRVSSNGHYIPSPGPDLNSDNEGTIDGTIWDPLFELEQQPIRASVVSLPYNIF